MPSPKNDRNSSKAPLPMFPEELAQRGWKEVDILLVTGDAYVDHPAFGTALLARWLEANGFRVGIVAQPRWDAPDDLLRLGRPRLFAGVTAGALDSMLAHYTAFRKKRSDDAYTPGGLAGARPNRATIVYTSLVRAAFPGLPVVIGGIEASLRRASHYDFWTDAVRRSMLLDAKADLLVYGMGERAILEIAQRLAAQPEDSAHALRGIRGTAFALRKGESAEIYADARHLRTLPSHEEIVAQPAALMTATLILEEQVHNGAFWTAQETGGRTVLIAPPAAPLETPALDKLYALPFTRRAHPSYTEAIPALEMIQFSITAHRGCGGGCAFCSLALHQGRRIQSRSAASIEAEARRMTEHLAWRGSVSDVGGPTANMWGATCARPGGECTRKSCLTPRKCAHFRTDQRAWLELLKRVERLPGVRHVRVASGIRHDLALEDPAFTGEFLARFVGGQVKLAPEHCSEFVLRLMRKPSFTTFADFLTVFERVSRRSGKEQYIVPYLLSGLPGCRDVDMRDLARWFRRQGWRPQQVQCFVPTPGTVATAMFHACIAPDGSKLAVAKTDAQRLKQHGILFEEEDADGPSLDRTVGHKPPPKREERKRPRR